MRNTEAVSKQRSAVSVKKTALDLEIDNFENPERYPLKSKVATRR